MRSRQFLYSGLIITLLFALNIQVFTQQTEETKVKLSSGFDLVSCYHWRGLVLSPNAAVQPFMEATYGGFTLGTWGSTTLQPFVWQEVSIYLSHEWKYLRFSIFDYFYDNDTLETPHFFDYRKDNTAHVLKFSAEFLGTDNLPFRFLGGYNFYGADPSNSIYLELAWMKNIKNIDFEIFSGYTPNAGYYHETRRGITNIGVRMTRNLEINQNIIIPLDIALVYNPMIRKTFLVAAIGLK